MDAIVYVYEISGTTNQKVDFEKLEIEVLASEVPNVISAKGVDGQIYIKVKNELTSTQLDNPTQPIGLNQIIANHDGESADVTVSAVEYRENKIRELSQMALYHPNLVEDDVVEYLTSIDNWFNAWKRLGKPNSIINKIILDANTPTHPQYTFLNTNVNSDENKTWEFLVGKITGAL